MTKSLCKLASTALLGAALGHGTAVRAAEPEAADLSLEDLLRTEVVTVSRKVETLQSTAAAAFVITREDIERSGATSIPEALRMAPGVEVARIANDRWAVTVRGFNGRFANKLLVLVDGRSIYSPLFSGVMWEFVDVPLEDIDRIEVIRGPGASVWGANAVNGVINIITRKARDTQGDLLVGRAGTTERAMVEARHGAATEDGNYRVWAKGAAVEPSVELGGEAANDSLRSAHAGFRRDGALAAATHYSLSGEVYAARSGDRWILADVASPTGATPTNETEPGLGAHLLGRNEWIHDDGSASTLQSYLDYGDMGVRGQLHDSRLSFDLDFQRHLSAGARQDIVWGLGYRYSRDDTTARGIFDFQPERVSQSLASVFVQDEVTLLPERLRVIAGARLEHNNYTGYEPQPNLRAIWTPAAGRSFWAALSRAVRTPSRAEESAQADLTVAPAQPPALPLPLLVRNVPPPDGLESEKVNTLELGYREALGPSLSFDLAAFASHYFDLRSALGGTPFLVPGPVPYVEQPITPVNAVEVHTRGLEFSADWHVLPTWRMQLSYSLLRLEGSADSADPFVQADAVSYAGSAPKQRWSLRSSWTPSGRQQVDLWLRHVANIPDASESATAIDGYTTADLRYAWKASRALELSAVGQNLLQRRHTEFVPDLLPSVTLQAERGFYLKAKYQF